jgi:hypothetical protein
VLDGRAGVVAFVERKRRWLFDAQREITARHRAQLRQRYASGAKLMYRGRELMLDVQSSGDADAVAITVRNRVHIVVPPALPETERLEAIRNALGAWLRQRALREVERVGRRHAGRLGIEAAGFRLSESRSRWGSCGRDGVVRVNWELIQAPAAALDYVVAHEVVHLVERHHGPAFWRTLARTMPDWAERKRMLERWETARRTV